MHRVQGVGQTNVLLPFLLAIDFRLVVRQKSELGARTLGQTNYSFQL